MPLNVGRDPVATWLPAELRTPGVVTDVLLEPLNAGSDPVYVRGAGNDPASVVRVESDFEFVEEPPLCLLLSLLVSCLREELLSVLTDDKDACTCTTQYRAKL